MLEHAIGLRQRAARRHNVVENEAAFVHLGQQIGAQQLITGPRANHQKQADSADPQRLGQRPLQNAPVHVESTRLTGPGVPARLGLGPPSALGILHAAAPVAQARRPGQRQRQRSDQRRGHGDGESAKEHCR